MTQFRPSSLLLTAATAIVLLAGCWYFSPALLFQTVQPVDGEIIGGERLRAGQAQVFASFKELRQVDPGAVVQSEGRIDFSRHDLVQVRWTAPGYVVEETNGKRSPVRFGNLAYRTRLGGKHIQFYVQNPVRLKFGQLSAVVHSVFQQRLGEDWFVVPTGATVEFSDAPAVTTPLDLAYVLLFAVTGVLTLQSICSSRTRKQQTSNHVPVSETQLVGANG